MTSPAAVALLRCCILLSAMKLSTSIYVDTGVHQLTAEEVDSIALAEALEHIEADLATQEINHWYLAEPAALEAVLPAEVLEHLAIAEAHAYDGQPEPELSDEEIALVLAPARRRRRGPVPRPISGNPLQPRVQRLEAEVKILRAWVSKLADQIKNPPVPTPEPPIVDPRPPVDPTPEPPIVDPRPPVDPTPEPPIVDPRPPVDPTRGPPIVDPTRPPVDPTPEPPIVDPRPPVVPPVVSIPCEGKDEGTACKFSYPPGSTPRLGVCSPSPIDRETLYCKAMPPSMIVCFGKKVGDFCTFGPRTMRGTCTASGYNSVTWCKPTDIPPPTLRPEEPPYLAACTDKEEGEGCKYSQGKMMPRKGICTLTERKDKKVMYCKVVPQPVSACAGKPDGVACQYTGSRGPVNGTCHLSVTPAGNVTWCKHTKDAPPSVLPPMAACKGKEEGEGCEYSYRPGWPSNGVCTLTKKGDKELMWCKNVPPAVAACLNMEEGEKCKFTWGDKGVYGTCHKSGKVTWCRHGEAPPTKMPPVKDPDSPLDACSGKKEGAVCEFSFIPGMNPMKGQCTWAEKGGKKVIWCKPRRVHPAPPDLAACAHLRGRGKGEPCKVTARPGVPPYKGTPYKGKCTWNPARGNWCKPTPETKPSNRRRRRRDVR